MPDIHIPRWACSSVSAAAASPLQHVNRYYWIYVRHLNCMIANAGGVWGKMHREALIRILEAEKRDATAEFNAWKEANGYAASRA